MTTMQLTGAKVLRGSVLGFIMGPCLLCAWTPRTYPAGSTNLTVNTAVRNDVVAFWHGVYQASEGYQDRLGWTGNHDAPGPNYDGQGTTSAAFVTDVERRLNFYRAMCNVPAGTRMNTGATVLIEATDTYPTLPLPLDPTTTKSAAAQRAAYMMTRTFGYYDGLFHPPLYGGPDTTLAYYASYAAFSHTPVKDNCVAWTTAAWNANNKGNIAMGSYGPGAIDAYMAEDAENLGVENSEAGHRRLLIDPVATDFATGDIPGKYNDPIPGASRQAANVTYAKPKATEQIPFVPRFVAYPPAGFFPAPLNPAKYWSLSYPGATFGGATVTITPVGGAAWAAEVKYRGSGSIIWKVEGTAAAVKSVNADTAFNVTVAGITGTGVPSSYSYAVTLINPNQITSDQALFGATSPAVGIPATYKFTPPPEAEAIQVSCYQQTTDWTEGAEDSPPPGVIANTSGTYPFRSDEVFAAFPGYWTAFAPLSGSKSFRLTFPAQLDPLTGIPLVQSFELTREIVPGQTATLNFKYRRSLMSRWTHLVVETSADEGVSWTRLGSSIPGNVSGYPDAAVIPDVRALAASTSPIRVRFRFLFESTGEAGQTYFPHDSYPAYPTGIWIDDITSTNCQWLELKKTNDLAATATSFELNNTTAGVTLDNHLDLRLRLRAKLGNHWMPYGEIKSLTVNSASMTDAPQFSPASGKYPAGQVITLTGESGATISYRINGGATQSAASPVTDITIPAYPATLSIIAFAQKAGRSDSAIAETSYTSSPFTTWANLYFPGVSDPAIVGPAADPDKDGQPNVLEFGLGGNPNGGGDLAKTYPLTNDGTATRKLLLTIAVRAGTPAFAGSPSPSATSEGITYAVLGGLGLAQWDSLVSVVTPPQTAGLPAAPAGYEYRTFKLNAADGLPSKGFLRVRVTTP